MKKALILMTLALTLGLSGVGVSPIVRADAVEIIPGSNAYTIVDTDEGNLGYETICHQKYYTNATYDLNQEEEAFEKTVIAFDTPATDFASINRLTMRITYYVYGFLDVFHWNPRLDSKTFIIKSTDKFYPVRNPLYSNQTALTWGLGEGYPAIGKVSDLILYEETQNFGFIQKNRPSNDTWNTIFVRNSALYGKEHYVVLPVGNTLHEVWISIDGYTTDNDHISDGLDEDGLPFSDEVGDYIAISDLTAFAVNFTSEATITGLDVRGITPVEGSMVLLQFGNYNFQTNSMAVQVESYEFSHDEFYTLETPLTVPENYEAVITFVGVTAEILIYYTADTPAVLSDVVDPSGTPQPDTTDVDGDVRPVAVGALILGILLAIAGGIAAIYFFAGISKKFSHSYANVQKGKYFQRKRKYHR